MQLVSGRNLNSLTLHWTSYALSLRLSFSVRVFVRNVIDFLTVFVYSRMCSDDRWNVPMGN